MFDLPLETKPFTKQGILSLINSIFGFIAPVKIKGRMLLKEISQGTTGWDDQLSQKYMNQWSEWINSLESLKDIKIPRCYTSQLPKTTNTEIHIFFDASKNSNGAVAYLKTRFSDNSVNIGFLIGKAKVAPIKGHSLPRLELCAAVTAIEIHEIIRHQAWQCQILYRHPSGFGLYQQHHKTFLHVCVKSSGPNKKQIKPF